MSQYFIETKSKQPQFFHFNRVFENQEPDVDFGEIIKKFQEDFDGDQLDNWLKYWLTQGEQIVLQTWNEKYKEYLQVEPKEQDILIEEENEDILDKDNPDFATNLKTIEDLDEDSQDTSAHLNLDTKTWQDLWHEHREKIYSEQYLIFSTIFYNYYLDLKNSLETPLTITEEINEDLEEFSPALEDKNLTQDLENLKLLGLPTSFGGRPQNSSKKHKTSIQTNFSDFFSDSEMENESSDTDVEDKPVADEDPLHNIQNKLIKKSQKKRNRKLKNVPPFMLAEKGLLKYWRKRFSLFSRFDEGIRLDRESWFSVTPEKVAKHLADRLQCSVIVDGFCGSGGNAIQFALTCQKVIAIDIDPLKLEMAKHNAEIYKVSHKIEFILGDFLQISAGGKLKADTVFLSPPWGGPKYKNKKDFDIEKYLLPVKASELVEVSRNISDNVALFLPRNSNVKQIVKLAGVGKRCEIEHNYLDSRLVAITALYGEDILEKKAWNM